jgi:hypothetical protein
MSGVWERLWRVTCASCSAVLTWGQEPPIAGDYPVLVEAQRSARYAGWRASTDGWRCPNCPSPTGKVRR